jgi:hypothetical protein
MNTRISITRGDLANMNAAAQALAGRILPEGKAVAQFARLIRYCKPFVDEGQSAVDNVVKTYTPAEGATDAQSMVLRTQQNTALVTLTREFVNESDDLPGLSLPPQITEAMLPQVRKTDEKGENIAGLAGLIAALGPAYAIDAE